MKFFRVTAFDTAYEIVKKNFDVTKLGSETVSLTCALGRRVFSDVFSKENVPDYARSTVDGYAVQASNAFGATDSIPSLLKYKGKEKIGKVGEFSLLQGEAVYCPTGGEVPHGADAVVMVEYTEKFGDNVAIYKPVTVNENVMSKGEDVKTGEKIISRFETITVLKCGLLASLGVAQTEVLKRIKVAVISTGDELVPVEGKTQIGQIRDTNTAISVALLRENGFDVVSTTLIKDGYDELNNAVHAGAQEADIVLISGGSSIGERDYTERVLSDAGEILVHGIAIKPGKPTIVAKLGENKLAFGLPGHPMACLLTLKLLVIGALNANFGKDESPFVYAQAAVNFPSSPGRLTVMPVKLVYTESGIIAEPIFYKSGQVSVLAKADGYALIGAETEGIDRDKTIKVYLL